MGMDVGIDFRGTAGYVTDPATNTYSIVASDTYPTTRGGVTFGSTSLPNSASLDRDNSVDPRLAGIWYEIDGGVAVFQIDLDAANAKDIRLAMGDAGDAQGGIDVEVFDGTTSVIHLSASSIAQAKWVDATGVLRTSSADWVSNNQPATVTFATTTLIIKIGGHGATGNSVLAHIHIKDSSSPPPAVAVPINLLMQQQGMGQP